MASGAEEMSLQPPPCTVAALTAAVLDPNAARLAVASGEEDREIFELLVVGERWKLMSAVIFFTFQGLLFGLAVVCGLAAAGADDDALRVGLKYVEPGLSGFSVAFSQACLVGNLLRSWHSREVFFAIGNVSGVSLMSQGGDEDDLRRREWVVTRLRLLSAVGNTGVLVCSLLSAGSGAADYGAASWAKEDQPTWRIHRIGLVLACRTVFASLAMVPAALDLRYLVSPALPPGTGAYLFGQAGGAPTSAALAQPSGNVRNTNVAS